MTSKFNIRKSIKKNISRIMASGLILISLTAIFQIIACEAVQQAPHLNSKSSSSNKPQTDLEKNKRLWEQSKIDSYSFISSRFQGGIYVWVPVLIKVKNGTVISIDPIRERAELVKMEGYEDFAPVEKMFDTIQEREKNGDKVDVTYNKEFGYPEKIQIDPAGGGMDSQFSIEITKFEILKK